MNKLTRITFITFICSIFGGLNTAFFTIIGNVIVRVEFSWFWFKFGFSFTFIASLLVNGYLERKSIYNSEFWKFLYRKTYGKLYFQYANWRLRQMTKAGVWIIKNGNVRQIQFLGKEMTKLGKIVDEERIINLGHELQREASNIVLKRVFPHVHVNLTPIDMNKNNSVHLDSFGV